MLILCVCLNFKCPYTLPHSPRGKWGQCSRPLETPTRHTHTWRPHQVQIVLFFAQYSVRNFHSGSTSNTQETFMRLKTNNLPWFIDMSSSDKCGRNSSMQRPKNSNYYNYVIRHASPTSHGHCYFLRCSHLPKWRKENESPCINSTTKSARQE